MKAAVQFQHIAETVFTCMCYIKISLYMDVSISMLEKNCRRFADNILKSIFYQCNACILTYISLNVIPKRQMSVSQHQRRQYAFT